MKKWSKEGKNNSMKMEMNIRIINNLKLKKILHKIEETRTIRVLKLEKMISAGLENSRTLLRAMMRRVLWILAWITTPTLSCRSSVKQIYIDWVNFTIICSQIDKARWTSQNNLFIWLQDSILITKKCSKMLLKLKMEN